MLRLKISTSSYNDETASLMDYVCPDSHNLESWGDASPKHGDIFVYATYNISII